MAGGEATLIRESTAVPIARPSPRFLLPSVSGNRVLPSLPPLPARDLVLDVGIQAKFEGWADSTDLWKQWVAKLRPLHEPLWRELGVLEGILATTHRVRRESEGALLQLVPFWSPPTNTFVFPWGEATVTLEDIVALAGLPILGFPVREPRYSDRLEMADERSLAAVRAVLLMDQREGTGASWAEHFLLRQNRHQHQPEEAGGGRDEREQRLEHAAFLSLWLARFVLPVPSDSGSDDIVPGEEVLPIAVRLAHGHSAALAPAALASIYSDLSALHRHFIHSKRTEAPSVSAPMHILQLWVWDRFPELDPATAATASFPDPADAEDVLLPRAARWHDVHRAVDPGYARAVFRAPKEFLWRPYGSSFWVRRRGHGGARAPLSSFARCLQVCELVGVDYIEQYNPHRVARQLGFDQDVPGTKIMHSPFRVTSPV
ncbi:serine/threonine-protein phosphatase 7 long form homolog [Miscanthus floridulus]|uniref:serine/threonine-protein phosphatase 7 long form homolog n=1 Tax=Miscanthus floridulus TaxID=154761 RepID=UPI0034580EA9